MTAIEVQLRGNVAGFAFDFNFSAPGAGVNALFGPSGCGKTTLLRCLAGLERACSGRISVNGELWQDETRGHFLPAHQRGVGYVFQEASLFAPFSVRANLEYGLRRVPVGRRRIAFEQAVEWLGVSALLKRKPASLSGGERQRVAIARALLTSPKLLLLDEPLSGLDERSKSEILPYLERLHGELSIPSLYVSHLIDEVARLADYVVLLEGGTVQAQGALCELLTKFDSALAHLDSAGAVIDTRVAGHDLDFHLTYLDFEGGRLAVARTEAVLGKPLRVRILARDVSLARRLPQESSILNILPAQILQMMEDGAGRMLVSLQLGQARILARITRKSAHQLQLAPGISVYVQIKSIALLT